MITFDITLTDPLGLHARPAGELVKEVKKYTSDVFVIFNEQRINATRMMAIMRLSTKGGDTISIEVNGADEIEASNALKKLMGDF